MYSTASFSSLPSYLRVRRRWLIAAGAVGLVLLSIVLFASGGQPAPVTSAPEPPRNPVAIHHLPPFVTAPGATDTLLVVMAFVLVGAVLGVGVFFFWLHSLPERLVHNSTKVHLDIVAALALLSLFTHMHIFWVAALLLALVRIPSFAIPDFPGLFGRIAAPLEKIANAEPPRAEPALPSPSKPQPEQGA
jgi:hypothetical protein